MKRYKLGLIKEEKERERERERERVRWIGDTVAGNDGSDLLMPLRRSSQFLPFFSYISFSDMFTLLLAFYVCLFLFSASFPFVFFLLFFFSFYHLRKKKIPQTWHKKQLIFNLKNNNSKERNNIINYFIKKKLNYFYNFTIN